MQYPIHICVVKKTFRCFSRKTYVFFEKHVRLFRKEYRPMRRITEELFEAGFLLPLTGRCFLLLAEPFAEGGGQDGILRTRLRREAEIGFVQSAEIGGIADQDTVFLQQIVF